MEKKKRIDKTYTKEEWLAEGERRFGPCYEDWKFVCPKCGNVASGQDFKGAGAEPNSMYCECIGRYLKHKGCDWAAYGFFDICTVHVDGHPVFEFAEANSKAETDRGHVMEEHDVLNSYKYFQLLHGAVLARPGGTVVTSEDNGEYVVTMDACVASFRMTREQYDQLMNGGTVNLIPPAQK